MAAGLTIDFCGEVTQVAPGDTLTVGRDADIVVDDNPFLHRRFLAISQEGALWFVSNVGSQLGATVSDSAGGVSRTCERLLSAPANSERLLAAEPSKVPRLA